MSTPALAVLGSADLPGLGDQLIARVVGRELGRRLPGWRIDHFGPIGWNAPAAGDTGPVITPLGPATGARAVRLAARYRLAVLAPAFPLGGPLPEAYPVDSRFPGALPAAVPLAVRALGEYPAGTALASARDAESAALLGGARQVGHPGLLADRLVDRGLLGGRTRALRQLGVLPETGDYLVLHAPPGVIAELGLLAAPAGHAAAELGAPRVVLLPDELVLPAAVAEREGWSVLRPGILEDRLAVLAGARAVIAGDEHAEAACAGLGVPCVRRDRPSTLAADLLVAEPPDVRAERDGLDELFDELAQTAGTEGEDRPEPPLLAELTAENQALRDAHRMLRERLLAERHALVERLLHAPDQQRAGELERERELHAALAERHRALAAELAGTRAELEALRETKLFRWAKVPREAYGRLRR